jgi:hypothetical protein
MSKKDPYSILGLTPEAEEEVIETVYKSLVKKHHPDQGGDGERLKEIKKVYNEIQNEDEIGLNNSGQKSRNNSSNFFRIFDTSISTKSVTGNLSDELILEGDELTIGLTNVKKYDISDYVVDDSTYVSEKIDPKSCLIATVHVKNTTRYVQKFKPKEMRIIGDDGHRYDAQYAGIMDEPFADTKSLPRYLYAEEREMEPNTKANFITAFEDIPDSVEINKVVYPFKLFAKNQIDGVVEGKTRYVFEIDAKHWDEFQSVANGKLRSLTD